MDQLLEWRKEFPILDNTVYLISHSLGAMPRRTRDRLQEYADMWSTRGIRSWEEGWWMMATTVGDKIGERRRVATPPGLPVRARQRGTRIRKVRVGADATATGAAARIFAACSW